MIAALTRDMPAILFAIYGGNAHLCASTAREAHMISARRLCHTRHNLCLSIIDADGMTGMKR
jgi:hypothetical protein